MSAPHTETTSLRMLVVAAVVLGTIALMEHSRQLAASREAAEVADFFAEAVGSAAALIAFTNGG